MPRGITFTVTGQEVIDTFRAGLDRLSEQIEASKARQEALAELEQAVRCPPDYDAMYANERSAIQWRIDHIDPEATFQIDYHDVGMFVNESRGYVAPSVTEMEQSLR